MLKLKNITKNNTNPATSLWSVVRSKAVDYSQLMKLRLLFLVVFSSALTYIIVASSAFDWTTLFLLSLGGVLVAGGANAINQILEKDFDALMNRTMLRPLPDGRMSIVEAIVFAGVLSLSGIIVLLLINPNVAVLGALALISYAFIYTPFKRISSFSVFIGAFPGALPIIIGGVAYENLDYNLLLLIFAIQFFWQFPHFWAIAWKADAEYKKAGYMLLPSRSGEKDKSVGRLSFLYSLVLIPITIVLYLSFNLELVSFAIMMLASFYYSYKAFDFWRKSDDKSALQLMFSSFIYLPVVLLTLFFDFINIF